MAALVVAAAVASLVAFFFVRSGDGGSDGDGRAQPELDPAAGRRHAATACAHFDRFLELVEADARSDTVFERLERGQDAAADAARADPTWIDLSGGLGGLEVGFRNNDPEAARLSVTVTRSACERLPN